MPVGVGVRGARASGHHHHGGEHSHHHHGPSHPPGQGQSPVGGKVPHDTWDDNTLDGPCDGPGGAQITTLPPPKERIFTGQMEKKAVSNKGFRWQSRFAVLSQEHLAFAKILDDNEKQKQASHWVLHGDYINIVRLREVFEMCDVDKNGGLDKSECRKALITLDLFSKDEDVDYYFAQLDDDNSGLLQWDEFKMLAHVSMRCNSVIDYIPLVDITSVEYELVARDSKEGRAETDNSGTLWSTASLGADDRGINGPPADGVPEGQGHLAAEEFSAAELRNARLLRAPSMLRRSLHMFEDVTGLEIERSRDERNRKLPAYDPDKYEVHVLCERFSRLLLMRACMCTLPYPPLTHVIESRGALDLVLC